MQFLAIFNSKSAYFTLHPCNLHVWAHADLTWYDHISPISWYTFGYLQFYVWFLFGRSAGHFSDSWWILAIFGNSFFGGINTPYFGLFGWTNSIFSAGSKRNLFYVGLVVNWVEACAPLMMVLSVGDVTKTRLQIIIYTVNFTGKLFAKELCSVHPPQAPICKNAVQWGICIAIIPHNKLTSESDGNSRSREFPWESA